METCEDCKFWGAIPHQKHNLRACKRFPPVLDSRGTFVFPHTPNYEWCGEYAAKPPEPETGADAEQKASGDGESGLESESDQ